MTMPVMSKKRRIMTNTSKLVSAILDVFCDFAGIGPIINSINNNEIL